MSWTAPLIDRGDPNTVLVADERTVLENRLEVHRATFLAKCGGLTGEQLALRAMQPSNVSLLGLVRHLTQVERTWFVRFMSGDESRARAYPAGGADFDDLQPECAERDYERLLTEMGSSRAISAGFDLDDEFEVSMWDRPASVRWNLIHMIEEYARHNGHADVLRERIDGTTGW